MYLIPKLLNKLRPRMVYKSNIHKSSRICGGVHLYHSSLGKNSYVGDNTQVIYTKIGAYCSIASNCFIGGANHPLHFVSTSPVFHSGRNILRKNFSSIRYNPYQETEIDNDVWIGHGAIIKGGVHIASGAVIAMGAVVTKDVGPYEIWGGNPAKLIRRRFSPEIIEELLRTNWWDWDESKLRKESTLFLDPSLLIANLQHRG